MANSQQRVKLGANLEQSMHKSKLGGFIIDCRTDDLDAAASFWSRALGMPMHELTGSQNIGYRGLTDAQHGLDIEVQQVDHPSRVHLDIETDNIEAEVGRLEALGAKRLQKVHDWWVMEAPTGQRFCVVRARPGDFERRANTWR
jgi:catechol 2,3-dioxygenase-like lactoylglutathione lyase family enzyme